MNAEGDNQAQQIPFLVGGWLVEPQRLRVSSDQLEVRLEPRVMQLLLFLARHPGRVIGRAELEETVWQGLVVGDDALTNAITKLRRAFGDDPRKPKVIETIPKTGYRLIATVEAPVAASAATPQPEPPSPADEGNAPAGKTPGADANVTKITDRKARWPLIVALAALILEVIGLAMWFYPQETTTEHTAPTHPVEQAARDKPAIAVIPFDNIGGSPDQVYFVDGITSDLITDLSKISGIVVIAPGSVFPYRDTQLDSGELSQSLQSDFIVRGSIQRNGRQVRVNAQLLQADSNQAVWGERYDGDIESLFELQNRVARDLVQAMRIKLNPEELGRLAKQPTANLKAYDAFLRGLEAYGRRTKEDNDTAREHYERAVQLDPGFGRAVAGLALVAAREAVDGWTSAPEQALQRATSLAGAARKIDPGLPQVHFVIGQVALFRGEHQTAIDATAQAIAIDPNYADAYALRAWALNFAGRGDEAADMLAIAKRLNPVVPASYSQLEGEILYQQNRFGDAIAAFQRSLQTNPSHMRARMWLTATLVTVGDLDEAHWQADELLAGSPGFKVDKLQHAFPFVRREVGDRLLTSLRAVGL